MKALLIIFGLLLLTACSETSVYAPVINGWQQTGVDDKYYRVQAGDTLYSVAWAFNLDYRDLARLNHLTPPYAIEVGQRLNMQVPLNKPRPVPLHSAPLYHQRLLKQAIQVKKPLSSVSKSQPHFSPPKPVQVNSHVVNQPQSIAAVRSSIWRWPTQGRLIAGFSAESGGNKGLNITGKLGQPVVATAAGKVVYCGSGLRGYGQLIIVKHSNNYLSAYAFNQTMLVKEGDLVKAGQVIATMGKDDEGKTMLHFEIRRNGKPLDPLILLQKH